MKTPYCLLLTGPPNSGKSTLAYHLVQNRLRNVLIIDGDRHREMQFLGETLGFSRRDILKNNEHVIKLARFAQNQKINVVIAQIAPYKAQRNRMKSALENFIEIYCECPLSTRSQRDNFTDSSLGYEWGEPDLIVDTTESIEDCVDKIMTYLNEMAMIDKKMPTIVNMDRKGFHKG